MPPRHVLSAIYISKIGGTEVLMGLHQQKQFITVFEFAWVSLVNSFLEVMVEPSFFPYYILDDTLDNDNPDGDNSINDNNDDENYNQDNNENNDDDNDSNYDSDNGDKIMIIFIPDNVFWRTFYL